MSVTTHREKQKKFEFIPFHLRKKTPIFFCSDENDCSFWMYALVAELVDALA